MPYQYDKNRNYSQEIRDAEVLGDFRRAAILEAARNAKIQGENMGPEYKITHDYAAWLPHQEQINSGMDRLAEQKKWSYNAAQDPAWQAARKQYLREADRGTRDTMAAAAGMTGGVPSTAAVAAGQQAGNYYRAQLADRLPEYMQQDYNRWANNREMDRADLQTLAALDQNQADYSLNLQQFQYTKDQAALAAAMNRWATLGYADQSVADALGVPVGTSTQDAAYRKAQLEYQQWQQNQDERNSAYNRAMTWINMGVMPSDADLAAAGIDKALAQQYLQKAQAAVVGRSYSGGGGSTSGGTVPRVPDDVTEPNTEPTFEYTDDYNGLRQTLYAALQSGNTERATQVIEEQIIRNPKLSQKQKEQLLDYFQELFGIAPPITIPPGERWRAETQ